MAQVMINCPACRSMVAAGGRFCPRCGAFLANVSVGRSARPGWRLAATAVDWGVIAVACLITLTHGSAQVPLVGTVPVPSLVAGAAALVLLAYLVWWLFLFSDGGSPGKRLFGLQVIDDLGNPASFFTMLIREWFGKVLSAGILGLGFLWALFDDNHQAWHDKILGTYVIDTGPVEIQQPVVADRARTTMPPAATTMGGVRRI